MNIIYMGSGAFGLPSLEAIRRSRHRLAGIVTGADKPQGRALTVRMNPVKEWSVKNNVPLVDAASLKKDQADIFVVIAYGVILPQSLIDLPKYGTLNVHASLLPAYRGASPIQSALLNGDTRTGVTVMRMVKQLDAGDAVTVRETPIEAGDHALTLESRLSALGAEALLEALDRIESNTAVYTPQDPARVTYAAKIKKEDGRIDWARPAKALHDQVRAFRRWPKAFTFSGQKRILILAANAVSDRPGTARPGQILAASAKEGLRVAASEGSLDITEIQPEGKNPMPARQFIAGARLKAGDVLE